MLPARLPLLLLVMVSLQAAAQTTTAPPRYSFPPIIESVTPSTGVTASGARVSARVPGLEPEMLDYYQSKMNPTPTPDGGVKYGAQRTARVRVSPTDVIDVPFKETLKADKALLGKAVAKFAKVLPIVGNVVALAELADFGLDYANGGFVSTPAPDSSVGADGYKWFIPLSNWQTTMFDNPDAACFAIWNSNASGFKGAGWTYAGLRSVSPTAVQCLLVASSGGSANPVWDVWRNSGACATGFSMVNGVCKGQQVPASDAEVETAVGKAIDRDVSAAIRMAELAGRKVLEEMSSSTPVEFEAAPQSTPSRQESVTQTDRPDGSVDTSTTAVQTTVTPTVSGSTIGNGSMTLNSNSTYTTSTTNNVTNNTSVTQTTVNNNGGGSAPKADEVKIEVCGLPNTPPCKIDETGTKTADDAANVLSSGSTALDAAKEAAETAAGDVMTRVDSDHASASAHFISMFNLLPTFGNEVCAPLTWSDGDRTMTIDFCPGYYIAKDVFSIFVSLGFLLSSVFMVAGAIRV